MKYACMLNGVTHLMLMKIDVLNQFENIKICEQYEINGEKTEHVPYDVNAKINPIYSNHKGWCKDTEGMKSFKELPDEMQNYVHEIEQRTNLPIAIISTSPNRDDTIIRAEL